MARTLTKKQRGFVKDYLDTGNGTLAVKQNYNVANDNVAGVLAHNNIRKTKIQEYIANHAEDAEAMIYQLSQKAKAEFVRLGASKDIMDRAGYKPVEKTQNTNINIEVNSELENKSKEFDEWRKQHKRVTSS